MPVYRTRERPSLFTPEVEDAFKSPPEAWKAPSLSPANSPFEPDHRTFALTSTSSSAAATALAFSTSTPPPAAFLSADSLQSSSSSSAPAPAPAPTTTFGLAVPAVLYDTAPRPRPRSFSFVSTSRRFGERDSTAGSTVQVDTACHEPVRDLDEIIQTAKPMREFELRGWSACVGADDATYFYHRATQIVTDMDLRSSSALSLLSDMMDVTCVVRPPPDGWELWIQMLPSTASDVPTRCHWIHHETRWISRTCPEDDDSERCSGLSKTERLEMDIRYWSYVEAHPSHESAYLRTVSSAINLLTRCHAELILSTPDRTAPPFTLDECQKLTDMINSLGSAHLSPEMAFTRASIAARIHIRIATCRLSSVSSASSSALILRNPTSLIIQASRDAFASQHVVMTVFYVLAGVVLCLVVRCAL